MKEVTIYCSISNSKFNLLFDEKEEKVINQELCGNLQRLLIHIPEYNIKRYYGLDNIIKKERSVIIRFPYDKVINFFNSNKKNYLLPVQVIVENQEQNDDVYIRVAHSYYKLFLYDLFISLNLVSPGSFDIYSWSFHGYNDVVLPKLHSFNFRMSRNILYDKMGLISNNSIESVISRIKYFYRNHDSLPDKPILKSLNTLLHLSIESHDKFSPENGLLITYSLESLLGGSIPRSLLVKRLCLVLGIKESSEINKTLKSIYDWRNKVVHGEYKLPHPGIYDVSSEYDVVYSEYFEVLNYGFSLILSLIQVLMKNNSSSFYFEEKLAFLE